MEKGVREIILVRHAEAEASGYISDRARKLTTRGEQQAFSLGAFLKTKECSPNLVLCSPAIRTRQTLHGILESVYIPFREYPENLYNSSVNSLLEWIRGLEDRHSSVMIVGHNPSIHMLSRHLAENLTVGKPGRFISYPSGTVSAFENSCTSWKGVSCDNSKLIFIAEPGFYIKNEKKVTASK